MAGNTLKGCGMDNRSLLPGRSGLHPCFMSFLCILLVLSTGAYRHIFGEEGHRIRITPSRTFFNSSDTVVLAVTVDIPQDFVLLGNPVGPGIGRPLTVSFLSMNDEIKWLEVRKLPASKYGAPFGDWVWAYTNRAFFFCVGVIADDAGKHPHSYLGDLRIEGLLCRNECRAINDTISLSLSVTDNGTSNDDNFGNDTLLRNKFLTTQPMIVFESTTH